MKNYVLNFMQTHHPRSFYQSLKKEKIESIDWILHRTAYLPKSCKFNERLYHIKHNIFENVICLKCNKPAKFNTFNLGYRFCSVSCNARGKNTSLSENLRTKNYDIWVNRVKEKNIQILSTKSEFIKTGILILQCMSCFTEYKRKLAYDNTCPKCSKQGISKMEKDVLLEVSKIYNGNILENKKKIIRNPITNRWLELDIYLPEIKKAIEFNGTYWHKDKQRQLYDKIKKDECIRNNISLLVIKEDDWLHSRQLTIDSLKNFIVTKTGANFSEISGITG